jgi:hypothetical protein
MNMEGEVQMATTLEEKIEARRTHANARIMMAGIELVPNTFSDYQWPEYSTEFVGKVSPSAITLYPSDAGFTLGHSAYSSAPTAEGSPVKGISKEREQELTDNTNEMQQTAEGITKEYVQTREESKLNEKIEKKRKEHEKRLIEQNNAYWEKVKNVVKDLPEPQQDTAISIADRVAGFASWLWGKITDFFVDLANKIKRWAEAAFEFIKNKFVEFGNTVATFFKSLFG